MNNQKITTKNDFLLNRIKFLKEIITKTMLSCQKYKLSDILGTNEVNVCINTLESLFKDIQEENKKINLNKFNLIETTSKLNKVEEELLLVIKNFGTDSLDHLIKLLFDEDLDSFLQKNNLDEKYKILTERAHPINYKILPWKQDNIPNTKSITKK